jgi:starch synthase (maltosyl-transferring)
MATTSVSRIPVLDVSPVVEGGRFPAKAAVGETIDICATVFREGHDQLGCDAVLSGPDGIERPRTRMSSREGVDRYGALVTLDAPGDWTFAVASWSDPLATWSHDAGIKIRAGVDVELMFVEGVLLLRRMLDEADIPVGSEGLLTDAIAALSDKARPVEARLAVAESPELLDLFHRAPLRDLAASSESFSLRVDRAEALFSSWYEFFPRSEGAHVDAKTGAVVGGTFRTAAGRLPAVAAMGFDVIYLPPIHPIGEVNRKGPNNTLDPGPHDVGSPWAIGSKNGGHDKVHPDLGTMKDFDAFVAAAHDNGLEVALDLALQAAPDHPWVDKHPEWFTTRADGTIAYAENPPKKYQDIYPVNFDNDPQGIYAEVLRVVRLWIKHGVRIFRVDNPHTKPVAFWERLLADVRRREPDVLFLAEAFTKPPMMHALAKVGFHQSYTYFTWRTAKQEIEEYFLEVAHDSSAFLRPNFWVNTPDILHAFLQYGGPAAFKIRAVLAATGSSNWGVYAGFELFEHVAVRPGSEEYLDSEKYQIRIRDWAGAEEHGQSLAPYLTRLNAIRRERTALQQLRGLTVHWTDDDAVICYSKQHPRTGDTVVVVVNLDPHSVRETTVHLDVEALGLEPDDGFDVTDEITGATWQWGAHNYVRLDPGHEPAHILTVRRPT